MTTQPSKWFAPPVAPEPQHARPDQPPTVTPRQRDQTLGLRAVAGLVTGDERLGEILSDPIRNIGGHLNGDRLDDLRYFAAAAEAAGAAIAEWGFGPGPDGRHYAVVVARWSEHVGVRLQCEIPPDPPGEQA